MDDYRHHLSAFFAQRAEAEAAFNALVEQGLPRERLRLLSADQAPDEPQGSDNEVLTNVVVDSAIGAAVGTGIGALAQVALIAANVTLFVASPLVAPLAMLGWGASLGALAGGAVGARADVPHKDGWLSDLVRDAIASGQFVVVAETRNAQETARAGEVLQAAVGEYNDLPAR